MWGSHPTPQVEDFCYITDNTYQHGQVLEMEREVLKTLGFNLSTPTVKTFLLRFLKAAESTPGDKLDCLASFLAELTLLEYSFLPYKPSMVAASAVMLALHTLNRPAWTTTLEHYAVYTTQDLKPCVTALHQVCARGPSLMPPLCPCALSLASTASRCLSGPVPGAGYEIASIRSRVSSAHRFAQQQQRDESTHPPSTNAFSTTHQTDGEGYGLPGTQVFLATSSSSLPAIREKYNSPKHKGVASLPAPASLPEYLFATPAAAQ